jgi:hypothetical protein
VTVFTFTVVFLLRAEGLGPKRLQHELKLARWAEICEEARNENVTIIGDPLTDPLTLTLSHTRIYLDAQIRESTLTAEGGVFEDAVFESNM